MHEAFLKALSEAKYSLH